jgi:hypothetical protein
MPIGNCALCLRMGELQSSHGPLPRAVYRRLRNPPAVIKEPVWMTADVALATSKHGRDFVLCARCESLLSRNGEDYAARQMSDGGKSFPLLEALKDAPALGSWRGASAYSAPTVGINTEKLAYFALSVLWRSAVHDWPIPAGGRLPRIGLAGLEEVVRKYLVDSSSFPRDTCLIITVATDQKSRGVAYEPSATAGFPGAYGFLACGIHFAVFLGSSLPSQIREICCVTSPRRPIFCADIEGHTDRAMGPLAATARIAGRLSEVGCAHPSKIFHAGPSGRTPT